MTPDVPVDCRLIHKVEISCLMALALFSQGLGVVWAFLYFDSLGWVLPVILGLVGLWIIQVFFVWEIYLRFRPRGAPPPPLDMSIDVFMPAYDESPALVERALTAAIAMEHPHRTFLLDDSPGSVYASIAARLGVPCLTREGNADFKAGNLNAALARTSGELVVTFDTDHIPRRDFLTRTIGYFRDPDMGFVQAMVHYGNAAESLVARAAGETAHEYFNITAVGKDRCGAASLMGSNAVLRRGALESIGGYKPGLAEDLETSLDLHAAGWRSVYVAEPLAPGMAPSDLMAFFKQQLKWSRGVFSAARRSLGDSFWRLDASQKRCYLVRFTYYLAAASTAASLIALGASLWCGWYFTEQLLLYGLPTGLSVALIRFYALNRWSVDRDSRKGVHFRGGSLVLSSWPIYLAAFLSTLFGWELPFFPTPKERSDSFPLILVAPQLAMLAFIGGGVIWRLSHWAEQPMPLVAAAGCLALASHWVLFDCIRRSFAAQHLARASEVLTDPLFNK
jgi:cellulose synthase/poly-beta-1,6-N-acetylglucosamine synthase-like glycosyltransferase